MSLSMFVISCMLIILFLMTTISSISYMSDPLLEKKTQFECGFNSTGKSKSSFSTKFFLIMILFLIFDLEIAILLPSCAIQMPSTSSGISPLLFILVVTLAMVIEWINGIIEWSI